ncbi:hypothetical protein PF005_g9057 [Phytophthora fragariae]|uniref:Uncharacterized protein n=1 Tax=Phytophthora fragariae TaxID=53985 RepID=A0A6A3YCT1_9STRA|nr:hypothetical protein PF003_g584 [Phytophthora fragariae]KAE8943499.1 hypothetical protein PF009_g6774 [Phytophthora fragariae]KAE9014501.1 hypothetical protein PF011_g8026 [Phytophthora fragariae]KAE9118551.1 hypothetical protein PF010_g8182 [Phytophthora fragariae]KAE9121199.1 hypothetical protein PF007_g7898 [Phytophthora fragariae]
MAEFTSSCSVPRSLPPAASLFSTSSLGDEWEDKLKSVDKDTIVAKVMPVWTREQDEDNQDNQDSDDPHEGDDGESPDSEISPSRCRDLQQLRSENRALVQRLALMETQHAQHIDDLEAKLQRAAMSHKEMEQKLKLQLETVRQEQQAAVENARKVRTILTRVSNWMRQVQRSAQAERHVVKTVSRDLELMMTPRSDSPYTLWTTGASLATNVHECHESPKATNNIVLDDNSLRSDCYGVQIDGVSEPRQPTFPPPAPGRNRSKSLPGKCFNYVGYSIASPCSRPSEVVLKPIGGTEIVLDGLKIKSRDDTPVPKRGPGSLFAYCAQVVTTSLAGVRSSPEPRAKVTPAWKTDRLAPVREELEVDEETGQCRARASSQRLTVAPPSFSIGLL